MNPIAIRLLSQQLISPQFSSPEEVVAHVGAMQAQDYRMMRWAVMMRMKKPSADTFRKAYDEGKIIRLHLLRGTWQLVSGDDYGWMLRNVARAWNRLARNSGRRNGRAMNSISMNRVEQEVFAKVIVFFCLLSMNT